MTPEQVTTLARLYNNVQRLGLGGGDDLSDAIDELDAYAAQFESTESSCGHKWVHMDTKRRSEHSGYQTHFIRTDTFFCEKCLELKRVVQDDYSRDTPDWY